MAEIKPILVCNIYIIYVLVVEFLVHGVEN